MRWARRGHSCDLESRWQNIVAADDAPSRAETPETPREGQHSPTPTKGSFRSTPRRQGRTGGQELSQDSRGSSGRAWRRRQSYLRASQPDPPFPSPPRPAGRGEESGADTAGVLPAPRTCTDEELRLPPDLPDDRLLPLLPSPPRPAREQRRKTRAGGAREQQAARKLLEGVVVASSTLSSDQRSQRTTRRSQQTRSRRDLGNHDRAERPSYDTSACIYTYT
jgi:hypothetical protein